MKIDMNDLMGENEIYLPTNGMTNVMTKEDIEKIFNSVKFNRKYYKNWKKKNYELSILSLCKKELDYFINLIEKDIYNIIYNFLRYPELFPFIYNFYNRKDLQTELRYTPKYERKLFWYYLIKKVHYKFEKKLFEF